MAMPKVLSAIVGIALLIVSCTSQTDEAYRKALAAERIQLNEEFRNPDTSPLDSADLYSFPGLRFFPANESYRVEATIEKLSYQPVFELPHSHEPSRPYMNYGYASFNLNGKPCRLLILEQVTKKEGYEDYLLLSFTDETNGWETYGGGRYLDLSTKDSGTVMLDFNKAYSPYCAYSASFTCPIPPKENHLPFRVEAGMKFEPKN